MINSLGEFYNGLSSDGVFFFWIIVFLVVFLLGITIYLIIKNKKLMRLIREEEIREMNEGDLRKEDSSLDNVVVNTSNDMVMESVVPIEEKENIQNNDLLPEVDNSSISNSHISEVDNGAYKKNVFREMSSREQTSPIHIEKREDFVKRENLDNFDFSTYDNGMGMKTEISGCPLEEMEDIYEENDNMKFTDELASRMEKMVRPSAAEIDEFERKQEEEAIISYDELLKVKDKIYNITEDEI